MKPENNKKNKKSVSASYAWGVAQIVAGAPLTALGVILIVTGSITVRSLNAADYAVYYFVEYIFATMMLFGAALLYFGISKCRLAVNYQKTVMWMQYKNRESMQILANVTKQNLTKLARDLRKMKEQGYYPDSEIDFERSEFVVVKDNAPAPSHSDGDIFLRERIRPTFKPFFLVPAILAFYAIIRPVSGMTELMMAVAASLAVAAAAVIVAPRVHSITENRYKALPVPEPEPINTGNETLDEFLTDSMGYVNALNCLSLEITNEKMILPIGELLNITRQIFSFIEKQPEKIRQIRQFMNYYLPTTIKLLTSYRDFSRQPLKGGNIKESMAKIEESMDGITETFRRELDNLYLDKAVDISVDIDMMLAMMRKQDIQSEFTDKNGSQ